MDNIQELLSKIRVAKSAALEILVNPKRDAKNPINNIHLLVATRVLELLEEAEATITRQYDGDDGSIDAERMLEDISSAIRRGGGNLTFRY